MLIGVKSAYCRRLCAIWICFEIKKVKTTISKDIRDIRCSEIDLYVPVIVCLSFGERQGKGGVKKRVVVNVGLKKQHN